MGWGSEIAVTTSVHGNYIDCLYYRLSAGINTVAMYGV